MKLGYFFEHGISNATRIIKIKGKAYNCFDNRVIYDKCYYLFYRLVKSKIFNMDADIFKDYYFCSSLLIGNWNKRHDNINENIYGKGTRSFDQMNENLNITCYKLTDNTFAINENLSKTGANLDGTGTNLDDVYDNYFKSMSEKVEKDNDIEDNNLIKVTPQEKEKTDYDKDLSGCNLEGLDLSKVDFTGANTTETNLDGTGANIDWADDNYYKSTSLEEEKEKTVHEKNLSSLYKMIIAILVLIIIIICFI